MCNVGEKNMDDAPKAYVLFARSDHVKLIKCYFNCIFTVTDLSGYWCCSTVGNIHPRF